MTWPLDVKEIPRCICEPIMIASMMGGLTSLSAAHRTMKFAPEPPALSEAFTKYLMDAMAFSLMGFSKYFVTRPLRCRNNSPQAR